MKGWLIGNEHRLYEFMSVISVECVDDDPQLLFTIDQPPKYNDGEPRQVVGVTMLNKCLYVVYMDYNKVEVFVCEDRVDKLKDIEVQGMENPLDMVGSSVTPQLFISQFGSDVILRVDLKTGVSDEFVKTGYEYSRLSLLENRVLVTSPDFLMMYDMVSGVRQKKIPFSENIKEDRVYHAIESNWKSFFVSHGLSGNFKVSEIDSEGLEIRVFGDKQQLGYGHLALDSVGRLLVADSKNKRVDSLNGDLKYKRTLIDSTQLYNVCPCTLHYDKSNNRLTVGLDNGHVKIFGY